MPPPTPPQAAVFTGKLLVSRTVPGTPPELQDIPLETRTFSSTPAMVSARMGRTINTGNFESVKIAVEVSIPCYPEEVAEAIEYTTSLASEAVTAGEEGIRKQLAPLKDD